MEPIPRHAIDENYGAITIYKSDLSSVSQPDSGCITAMTGGKARLRKTSKMGRRDIRTLLVSGAMAVLQTVERFETPNNGWLKRLLTRRPRMVAAIALPNKIARGLWATSISSENSLFSV